MHQKSKTKDNLIKKITIAPEGNTNCLGVQILPIRESEGSFETVF